MRRPVSRMETDLRSRWKDGASVPAGKESGARESATEEGIPGDQPMTAKAGPDFAAGTTPCGSGSGGRSDSWDAKETTRWDSGLHEGTGSSSRESRSGSSPSIQISPRRSSSDATAAERRPAIANDGPGSLSISLPFPPMRRTRAASGSERFGTVQSNDLASERRLSVRRSLTARSGPQTRRSSNSSTSLGIPFRRTSTVWPASRVSPPCAMERLAPSARRAPARTTPASTIRPGNTAQEPKGRLRRCQRFPLRLPRPGFSRQPGKPWLLRDRFRDVLRVASDAMDHRRRERIEKVEPDEVEPRLAGDHAALVPGLSVRVEDRQVDPGHGVEVRMVRALESAQETLVPSGQSRGKREQVEMVAVEGLRRVGAGEGFVRVAPGVALEELPGALELGRAVTGRRLVTATPVFQSRTPMRAEG